MTEFLRLGKLYECCRRKPGWRFTAGLYSTFGRLLTICFSRKHASTDVLKCEEGSQDFSAMVFSCVRKMKNRNNKFVFEFLKSYLNKFIRLRRRTYNVFRSSLATSTARCNANDFRSYMAYRNLDLSSINERFKFASILGAFSSITRLTVHRRSQVIWNGGNWDPSWKMMSCFFFCGKWRFLESSEFVLAHILRIRHKSFREA